MLAKTYASAVHGIEAQTITVEVNAGGTVAAGKQFYFLVGLPDNAVKEGFQRIEAAIKNIGLNLPRLKLVVNLAPADIKKEGSAYDLPIAIGVLASTGQLKTDDLEKIIYTWGKRENPVYFKSQINLLKDFCAQNNVVFIEDCPSPSGRIRDKVHKTKLIEFYKKHLVKPAHNIGYK